MLFIRDRVCQQFARLIQIRGRDHQAQSANSIGERPVHSQGVLVFQIARNQAGLEDGARQFGLSRVGKRAGDHGLVGFAARFRWNFGIGLPYQPAARQFDVVAFAREIHEIASVQ